MAMSFRENIREFLIHCAEREDYCIGVTSNDAVWCTLLVSETSGVVFPLFAVEESVADESLHCPCLSCRFSGWSNHFVSKRNYHLIIPAEEKWNKPLSKNAVSIQTHLLHGVVHCNGYGHLLTVNGVENNSKFLRGEELMNLWDHLCSVLQTREVSVRDVAKKGTMELRLVHGVAYGRSWFGKWNYEFSHGSFGVTKQKYERAIEVLSSLELDKIVDDFKNSAAKKFIREIVVIYRGVSEIQLVTVGDLIRFMLAFKSKSPIQREAALALASVSVNSSPRIVRVAKRPLHGHEDDNGLFGCNQGNGDLIRSPNRCNSVASFVSKLDGRWPARRLESAVKQIVYVLEDHGAAMCRQDLRNAVRKHIGDTGLIDFAIKSVDGVILGNQMILRKINPITKLREFSLQDVPDGANFGKKLDSHSNITCKPGEDVQEDLLFLYKNVLLGYPDCHPVGIATRAILNSKQLVKKWQYMRSDEDKLRRLICHVRPNYEELVNHLTRPLPPGELVILPQCVTISEFKLKVQHALRDTYFVMDKFVVKDIKIGEFDQKEDEDVPMYAKEQGVKASVTGSGLDLETKLRYAGGADDETVDCICGARDDDGERMVACDACHVWQHTLCNSIKDEDSVPALFRCGRCSHAKKKR